MPLADKMFSDLVAFPQMFSYSLEKRVKPRLEHLRGRGVELHNGLSLANLLRPTDSLFCRRHGKLKLTSDQPKLLHKEAQHII